MNVNNDKQNYSMNFKSLTKEQIMQLPQEERIKNMVIRAKEAIYEYSLRGLPENGKFKNYSIAFNIPCTNNLGRLEIGYDSQDPTNKRYMSIGVHHKNSDRMEFDLVMIGTKQEILDRLKSKDDVEEVAQVVKELSDRTDEYYSNL